MQSVICEVFPVVQDTLAPHHYRHNLKSQSEPHGSPNPLQFKPESVDTESDGFSLSLASRFMQFRFRRLLERFTSSGDLFSTVSNCVRFSDVSPITGRLALAVVCCAVASPSVVALGQAHSPSDRDFAAYVTSTSKPGKHSIRSDEIALKPLPGMTSAPVVTALVGSHDGRFLAAAGDDHAIRIIDVASQAVIRVLEGHVDWIQALAFASDSQTLFSCGNDGIVLRWQQSNGNEPEKLYEADYALKTVTVSTTRNLIAVGGFSTEILLLAGDTGKVVAELQCDCTDQRCVRFSPDGGRILCGSRDGDLRIWATETGHRIAEFKEHKGRVCTAAFSPDGRFVTSAGEDRQVVKYDLEQSQILDRHDFQTSKLMSMCLINQDLVAIAGADNSVHLYDTASREELAKLIGHVGTVAVMTPCGDKLASGSFDTTIRIWDLSSIDSQILAGHFTNGRPVSRPNIKMDDGLRIR